MPELPEINMYARYVAPIDSAPKNGMVIVVFAMNDNRCEPVTAFYDIHGEEWVNFNNYRALAPETWSPRLSERRNPDCETITDARSV